MAEVQALEAAIKPHERLFVVDSMAGQDAVNAAKAFNDALALTGVILTKADGDARGGAALSVRQVTGKPILFVGTGETIGLLEFSAYTASDVAKYNSNYSLGAAVPTPIVATTSCEGPVKPF